MGRYLVGEIAAIGALVEQIAPGRFPRSETYVLGDSPLVTLTALQSFFQPDPVIQFLRRAPHSAYCRQRRL